MKTIIIALIVIVLLALFFPGWGGYEKAGFEQHINYFPMRVNYVDLDLGLHPSMTLKFQCWMLPFERYIIKDGAFSTQLIPGMVIVDSGRCHGYAEIK